MHDPIDQFFATDFTDPSPPGLREAVLARTTRALRRRRVARRVVQFAALAACYIAGLATMDFWNPAPSGEITVAPGEPRLAQGDKTGAVASVLTPDKAENAPSLVELEWRAFDSRENRAALFFEVARRYYEEQHDLESALRCYGQALDAAPQADLAIRPDDNWLIMALKEARQKEENNATVNP